LGPTRTGRSSWASTRVSASRSPRPALGILHFATRRRLGGESAIPDPDDRRQLLETHVAWNHPDGGEPGSTTTRAQPRARAHEPEATRRECHGICLGQELGRDAAAVVFNRSTCASRRALRRRAYRYVHLDAATRHRMTWPPSPRSRRERIGGFFDDFANKALALRFARRSSIPRVSQARESHS